MALGFPAVAAHAAASAPVGQGFTVTPSDLAFILKQIKIAERHAATLSPAHPCDTLVGPGPNQIPDALTPYGLRTVDGSCNNLVPGREKYASGDQKFPRYATPVFKDAETTPGAFGPPDPTTYKQKKGNVFDSQPRMISSDTGHGVSYLSGCRKTTLPICDRLPKNDSHENEVLRVTAFSTP